MNKQSKKQNVILTDFKQSDDWAFKSAIEKVTKEEWTGIGLTSNTDFSDGGGGSLLTAISSTFGYRSKFFSNVRNMEKFWHGSSSMA